MAACASTVFAQNPTLVPFNVGNDAFVNSMSRNGRWATYQKQADATPVLDVPVIDMTDGSIKTYTPVKMIDYTGREVQMVAGSYSNTLYISDDGKTVYGGINGYPGYFTIDDLTWHCLSMGDREANRNFMGNIYTASGDGRILAGWYVENNSMTSFGSNLWVDGELKELTKLPTYKDLLDNGIITLDIYKEYESEKPNYSFRQLSEDGRLILLGVNHNYPGWGCSYGVYDLEADTFSFILPPKSLGESFTDSALMSDNGLWVTGNIIIMEGDLDGVEAVYRYNTASKEIELFYEMTDRDMLATAIDNDGTIFGASPASQPIRDVSIRLGDLWVNLGKVLDQKYGINYTAVSGMDNTGYVVAVSKDCKTIVSQAEMRGGAFSLTMPVNFAEAAEGTSLLTEYAVSPASGMQFAHLKSMMIRFGYESEPTAQDIITISDSKGNVISTSSSIEAFSVQRLVYTVNFPDTRLEENETYTVTFPEGSFVVPGTKMGNPEIKVTYLGRSDRPVQIESTSPKDGGYMQELSYNSPVTIAFDASLSLSTAVQPKLYEEGKETAIATLSAMVNNRTLTVYDPSSRKLRDGVSYRIDIPAGLVADLGQTGGNEPFSMTLNGTYIPTPSIYPFNDDFNSPAESLSKWLLYEGDHNDPNEEMAGLGFDRDNTPWNFSIRDAGETNYAAMSHSMYYPSGASDDWMLTSNIEIANDDYYLTFKAQGFNANKEDVLKIYIWENEDVINSIDSQTAAKMKNEAKLLTEFVVAPSQTTGVLAGNWTDYEFSLKEYAGKKVYIAFVNQNDSQSAILIDDVLVDVRGEYSLSISIPEKIVNEESVEIKGILNCTGDDPIKAYTATLSDGKGNIVSTITESDLNIAKGESHSFTFPERLPLVAGVNNDFTVKTSVGTVEQVYTSKIANHLFDIHRRILVEESTGMWCGNCPFGEVALQNLEEQMPEDIAVISVHNDDALAYPAYDQFLSPGGYPNGRINRSQKVYSPMYNDPDLGDYTFTSPGGDQTFMDAVMAELTKGAEGLVEIVDPVYYSTDKVLTMKINARFSLNSNNRSYNVFTCILEDELEGRQTNYFSGQTSSSMEWWTAQPGKVPYTYHSVARHVIGSFYGESERIPRNIIAGEDYTTNVFCPFIDQNMKTLVNVSNPDNMHFIVALIDSSTGNVVNASVCREFSVDPTPGGSSNSIDSSLADNVNARITVEDGTVYVNGDSDIQLFTVSGTQVNNSALSNGIYIIRKVFRDGSTYSGKVLVK